MESFAHPVVIVHMALNAINGHQHAQVCGVELVDVTSPLGDTLTLAVDAASSLPAWVSWVGPDGNLGDVTYRRLVHRLRAGERRADAHGAQHDDRLPVDRAGSCMSIVTPSTRHRRPLRPRRYARLRRRASGADHRSHVDRQGHLVLCGAGNSVLFEFDDHLTLFEVYASEANAKAVIDKARSLVPGKPLTEAIVSHHHFDHTGGLRAAVAEGLTIVMQRGNEAFIEDSSSTGEAVPGCARPRTQAAEVPAVDEKLVLKDAVMEVHVLAYDQQQPHGQRGVGLGAARPARFAGRFG